MNSDANLGNTDDRIQVPVHILGDAAFALIAICNVQAAA